LGNTKEALALIIEELEDVPQAIDFIKDSHDSSLWADLVDRSLKSPRFIAGLLGHIGTAVMMEKTQGVDPAQLISKIPLGMRVPGLRDRLVKIISDYTMQLQLRESCNLVLKADCFVLLDKLVYKQTRAMRVVADPTEVAARRQLESSVANESGGGEFGGNSGGNNNGGGGGNSGGGNNGGGGGKRRSVSVGTEPDMYGREDESMIEVPFSDKICYPGRHTADRVHTTRQSSDGRESDVREGGGGGGDALPRFG